MFWGRNTVYTYWYLRKPYVEYSWDERKNRANRKKHGVSFEMASLVFDDPLHISVQDREVDGEARWQTIGMIETSTCW